MLEQRPVTFASRLHVQLAIRRSPLTTNNVEHVVFIAVLGNSNACCVVASTFRSRLVPVPNRLRLRVEIRRQFRFLDDPKPLPLESVSLRADRLLLQLTRRFVLQAASDLFDFMIPETFLAQQFAIFGSRIDKP